MLTTPDCPYQGLHAFREQDAAYFFGRERNSERLWQAVQREPLVALVGASGSGKSSLAHAGVLPLARAAGWTIATFRPETDPFRSLAAGLLPLLEPAMSRVERLAETRKLATAFRGGDLPLADVLADVASDGGKGRLLLTGDQFEELYTLTPDAETRHAFLDLLLAAVTAARWGCLLLTMRADFLGRALSYRPFADALQDRQVNLGPMTREELEHAIVGPAAALDVTFEPGLVARILDDVERAPGSLPLLEFSLTEMWTRQATREDGAPPPLPDSVYGELRATLSACGPFGDNRELRAIFADPRLHPWREWAPQTGDAATRVEATIDALYSRQNGKGTPALALLLEVLRDRMPPEDACRGRLAELAERLQGAPDRPAGGLLTHAAYEAIGEVEGALARHADGVFDRLEEEEKAQVRRLFVQLVQPGAGAEDTRRLAARQELGGVPWELVARLADDRLVVTKRDANMEERVEVTHEALIQQWGRLQEWMDQDRTFRSWQERVRAALRQFEATGGDRGALLRGAALAEAQAWMAERDHSLGEGERHFIAESAAAARRQRVKTRVGAAVAVVFVVAAAVAFGLVQRNARLEQEALSGQIDEGRATLAAQQMAMEIADDELAAQNALADEAQATAEAAARLAQAEIARADRQQQLQEARSLVADGMGAYEQDPLLGLSLVLEGLALVGDEPQVQEDILSAGGNDVFERGRVLKIGGDVDSVDFSPDGSLMIVGRTGAPDELRRSADGVLVAEGVVEVTFSPDEAASLLLVTYEDAAELRRTGDGALLAEGVVGVTFSLDADASFFVVEYEGAPAELRRTAGGTLVATLLAGVEDVFFSRDGNASFFVVDYEERPAELRRTAGGARVATLAEEVRYASFNAAASLLFIDYADVPDELRRSADGSVVATLNKDLKRGPVVLGTAVTFRPDESASSFVVAYERAPGELRRSADGSLMAELGSTVYSVTFSRDEAASVFWSRPLAGPGELRRSADGALLSEGVTAVVFGRDEADSLFVAEYYQNAPVELRRTEDGSLVTELSGEALDRPTIWAIAFSPDEAASVFVVDYEDAPGELRRSADGALLSELGEAVTDVTFSPDESASYFEVEYEDAPTELRRSADGALVGEDVRRVAFSPDEAASFFFVDHRGSGGELWRSADGALLADGMEDVTFSPGDTVSPFVIDYGDAPGELRAGSDGALVTELSAEIDEVFFSPAESDSVFLVEYWDAPAELRRSADGSVVAELDDGVTDAFFSPDEGATVFVVGYDDAPAELRRSVDGALVAGLAGEMDDVFFSPGEAAPVFVVVYEGGRAELWAWDDEVRLADLGLNIEDVFFPSDSDALIVSHADGRAYVIDVAWLRAMAAAHEAGGLTVVDLVTLACTYPLRDGLPAETERVQIAAEYLGGREPRACE